MEKEKLEKVLNGIGIKIYWILEKDYLEEIKNFMKNNSYYVSPYLNFKFGTSEKIENAEFGIFEGIALCEKTGTILVSGDDLSSLIPPVSLVILKEKNIKKELDDLINIIKENPEKSFVFITGPSRTADIEKQVVIPAHGPKEILLFIVR